jgi:hypothetical protein
MSSCTEVFPSTSAVDDGVSLPPHEVHEDMQQGNQCHADSYCGKELAVIVVEVHWSCMEMGLGIYWDQVLGMVKG